VHAVIAFLVMEMALLCMIVIYLTARLLKVKTKFYSFRLSNDQIVSMIFLLKT